MSSSYIWEQGSPKFDFTQDSRNVYGGPWLECLPNPQDFVDYFSGEQSSGLDPWFMVSIVNGARSGDPRIIGDGYLENPYSDLVATGAYPPNTIVDIVTGEILLESRNFDDPAIIEKWVLPDAGLAEIRNGDQILRFAQGLEYDNMWDPLDVYCRLADGRYIFTVDGGSNVLVGEIKWLGFSYPGAVEVPELAGLNPYGCVMKPTMDSKGVLYRDISSLCFLEF